jgi:hypothetical protein
MQEKRLNVTKNKTRRNKDPNVEGNVQNRRENNSLLSPASSSSLIGTTTLSWVSACSTVVEHS